MGKVISFDGLHRSGKGTQLRMLADYLDALILRGDGSRKGDGSPQDPFSAWWQMLNRYLRTDPENEKQYWDLACARLNLELLNAYHSTREDILLDRSLISRLYRELQHSPDKTLEDMFHFTYSKKELKTVIPDLSFILHAPKHVLLERNEQHKDDPKYAFRKHIIETYYDLFEETTQALKSERLNIVHLDATEPAEKLFEKVRRFYECLRS